MADLSQIAYLGFDIDSSPARTAAGDLDKLTAAAAKTERASRSLSAASRNLLRDERGKFMSTQQAASKYAAEIDALRAKYNPLYAASKQMEAQQMEIKRALELGAISTSQAEAALENLQRQYINTAGAVDVYGHSMRQGGHHTANVFAQLNDISVMMASGQNPIILAMQQGMQLNQVWADMGERGRSVSGVFGTLRGAVASMLSPMSLLTLGVIAGGAALVQWGISSLSAQQDTRTFQEGLDDLSAALSTLREYTDAVNQPLEELQEKFGRNAEKAREVYAVLSQLQALEALDALTDSAELAAVELEGLFDLMGAINSASDIPYGDLGMPGYLRRLSKDFGLTREDGQKVVDLFEKMQTAQGPAEAANAARDLAAALMGAKDEAGKSIPEIRKIAISLFQASLKGYDLEDAIDDAKKAADDLAASGPGSGWLSGALARAGALATALWDAAAARIAAEGGEWSPTGDMPEGAKRPPPRAPAELGIPEFGGGGGGGGRADDFQERLDRLVDSLRTEREIVDDWYSENLEILNDRRAMELLGESAHKEALLDLEKEYLDRKRGLNDGYAEFSLSSADKLFGELHSLSGSKYDGLLRIQKTFAAASALVNTYTAAAQTLADPSVPFFAKFAAVAKTVAAGMGLVNAIKGGGSGGSGGLANSSATTQQRAEPERTVRIDLRGEEWMVTLAESMMTQIYDQSKLGRVMIARA